MLWRNTEQLKKIYIYINIDLYLLVLDDLQDLYLGKKEEKRKSFLSLLIFEFYFWCLKAFLAEGVTVTLYAKK